MLTREEDIDAHALRRQGWTISAIARHMGRDRKTIRAYLEGERVAGERKPAGDDPFEPFVDYVRARLSEDPHLWAVTLFEEVTESGTTGRTRRSPARSGRGGRGRTASRARRRRVARRR